MSCSDVRQNEERDVIQILRALAIIMVVFHHASNAVLVPTLINTMVLIANKIHVVVFFVISGYLFEKKKEKYATNGFKNFFIRKFRQLMVPYFIFSLAFALLINIGLAIPKLDTIVSVFGKGKSTTAMIMDVLLFRNVYFESLWFVYTLFMLFMVNYVLVKLTRNKIGGVPLLLLFFCTMLFKAYAGNEMWYILNKSITYFVWFYLGRFLTNKRIDKVCSVWTVSVSALLFFACVFRTYAINLDTFMNFYVRAIYIQIESTVITLSAILLLYALAYYLISKQKGEVLCRVGDYSYDIYLIHNPWLVSTLAVIFEFIAINWMISLPIITILSIIMSMFVSWFIKKNFRNIYRTVFGRC